MTGGPLKPVGATGDQARDLAAVARRASAPEVARLVADTGWGHPDAPHLRVLVFHSATVIVIVEATTREHGLRIAGAVRPAPWPARTVRLRRGPEERRALDESGRFAFSLVGPGPFSVTVESASGRPAAFATEWVTL